MNKKVKKTTGSYDELRKTEPMLLPGETRILKSPAAGMGKYGYTGSKAIDGVIQKLISLIPPHRELIECCGGSGGLTWNIRQSRVHYIIEADIVQANVLKNYFRGIAEVVEGDMFKVLPELLKKCENPVIYFDPPYLKATRGSQKDLYKVEWNEVDHENLLYMVTKIERPVIINHPRCEAYEYVLNDWYKHEYQYMTRGGLKNDCIWYNFPQPTKLHDYRFIGKDNTKRKMIKRKRHSLVRKISELGELERNGLFEELRKNFPGQ